MLPVSVVSHATVSACVRARKGGGVDGGDGGDRGSSGAGACGSGGDDGEVGGDSVAVVGGDDGGPMPQQTGQLVRTLSTSASLYLG